MKCSQTGCDNKCVGLYTWPGQNQSGICDNHLIKLKAVAQAMGMFLQIIPMDDND